MYHSSVRGGKISYPEKFSSSVLRLDFSPFVGKFNFWMAKVIFLNLKTLKKNTMNGVYQICHI